MQSVTVYCTGNYDKRGKEKQSKLGVTTNNLYILENSQTRSYPIFVMIEMTMKPRIC